MPAPPAVTCSAPLCPLLHRSLLKARPPAGPHRVLDPTTASGWPLAGPMRDMGAAATPAAGLLLFSPGDGCTRVPASCHLSGPGFPCSLCWWLLISDRHPPQVVLTWGSWGPGSEASPLRPPCATLHRPLPCPRRWLSDRPAPCALPRSPWVPVQVGVTRGRLTGDQAVGQVGQAGGLAVQVGTLRTGGGSCGVRVSGSHV